MSSAASAPTAELNLTGDAADDTIGDDSSCWSIDLDQTLTENDLFANTVKTPVKDACSVCKVTQLRREVGVTRLDRKRRHTPVGVSQQELQYMAKMPVDRPVPIGATQSFIDANADSPTSDVTSVSESSTRASASASYTTTVLSEMNRSCVRLPMKNYGSKRHHRASDVGHKSARIATTPTSTSTKASSAKKRKRGRSTRNEHDKENDASAASRHTTNASAASRHTTNARELKKRFKSFNASDPQLHRTLAIL